MAGTSGMNDDWGKLTQMWEMFERGASENDVRKRFSASDTPQRLKRLFDLHERHPEVEIKKLLFERRRIPSFGSLKLKFLSDLRRSDLPADEILRRLLAHARGETTINPRDWDIRRKGRRWSKEEFEARLRQAPEKIEFADGIFSNDGERETVLAMLLENLGIEKALQFGKLEDWKAAIAERR
jgi:hypothetical protein